MAEKKVAIVGCGAVTQKMYVKELPRVPNSKIVYVTDLNEELSKRTANILDARAVKPEEILENADAVIIATPPASHKSLVSYYLQKVPLIICEKPFVGAKKDAIDLVNLANNKGASLYVAHFRRCFPQVKLAKELIQTNAFGKIKELFVFEGGRFSWDTESEYISKDPHGGVLFDTGSHTLDMVLYVTGFDKNTFNLKIESIKKDKQEPSHSIDARISFQSSESNGIGRVCFSRYHTLANKIKIVMENGTIEFSVGLSDRLRITGKTGSSIVTAERKFENSLDCFRLQYDIIFNSTKKEMFESKRFINLSGVLETLSTAGGEK